MPMPSLGATVTAYPAVSSVSILRVEDSIAGLGTEAKLEGFPLEGNVDLVVVPPLADYLVFPLTLDPQGAARTRIPGNSTREAGTYRAFVGSQGTRLTADVAFEILADSVDAAASTLTVSPQRIKADGRAAATCTVRLRDRNGNPLPGRPVELVSANAQAKVVPVEQETDAAGTMRFSITTTQAGTVSLRALDLLSDTLLAAEGTIVAEPVAVGGPTPLSTSGNAYRAQLVEGAEAAALPTFGLPDRFAVTVEPQILKVDEMGNLTIRVLDTDGNTVEDYVGTVLISVPTDPSATLPGFSALDGTGEVRFEGKHRGMRMVPLSVSFRRTGRHALMAEDSANPQSIIRGETTVTVSNRSVDISQGLYIASPLQNATVGGATVMIEGTTQPYTNVSVSGGVHKAVGESDDAGRFAIPVLLDVDQSEYTLHITDDMDGDISLHLVRDADAPVVATTSFSPEEPQEGANTLLVIQSEPGLPSVIMQLGTEQFTLSEDTERPGTYQIVFFAPPSGNYQLAITAKDAAGNATTIRIPLTVASRPLPTVQNLRAMPKDGAVELSWDPVEEEPIEFYRVYAGEDADEYAYSWDTQDATRSVAEVTGLRSGVMYTFAVTAVSGNRESLKSEPVNARVLGLLLDVTPEPEALFVEWALPMDLSVQSFLLEYGTDADMLTEQRQIPGGDVMANERQGTTLRDLLPGVSYNVRLTPIDTTGDPLEELIVTGEGTPLAYDGTHYAAPGDVPPFDPTMPITPPTGQTPSGLPPAATWGIVAAAALLVLWQVKRMGRKQAERHFFRMMERRYHSV